MIIFTVCTCRLFIENEKIKTELNKHFSPTCHVPVECAGVKCMFEFIGYSYQSGQVEPCHPPQSSTQATHSTTSKKAGELLSKNNCEQTHIPIVATDVVI